MSELQVVCDNYGKCPVSYKVAIMTMDKIWINYIGLYKATDILYEDYGGF
jgi:hypothetical protein